MQRSICSLSECLLLLWIVVLCGQARPATLTDSVSPLRVSSDFPGGSATVLNLDQTNNRVCITPAGDPKRGWPCWWYMRLEGVNTNQPLILEVVANEGTVLTDNPGQTRKLPPMWSLPAQAAVSTNGTVWEHTSPAERQGNRNVYRVSPSTPRLWLAWGPPYTLKDANQLIRKACELCRGATSFTLARTRGGLAVPAVRFSQPGAERFGVWVQARQHAWECGSSWVLQGFVGWLVSNDPSAQSLRQRADIVAIPMMDVDSVEQGQGGKKQVPHDQDEDWGDEPYFPEVRAGMEQLSVLTKSGKLDLFLDLHNPSYGDLTIMFYPAPEPLRFPERVANENKFFDIVRQQMTGPIPFVGKLAPFGKTYDPAVDKCVDAWVAAQSRPYVVSLTLEIPWNTPASTPSGYLKTGQQLGRCIDLYLRQLLRPSSSK